MRQVKPQVTISPTKATSGDLVYAMCTGCTPNRTVMSHLLRPNGMEYNPIRLRTDTHGEFTHKIDTTMLTPGVYELWVEDEESKALSNRARFTVE